MPNRVTMEAWNARDLAGAFRKLDKETNKRLRREAKAVAEKVIAPAYRRSAFRGAKGDMARGQVYTATGRFAIYGRSDRFATVVIGRRVRSYGGGASSIIARYQSRSARWLPLAKPMYEAPALAAYERVVFQTLTGFNRGA